MVLHIKGFTKLPTLGFNVKPCIHIKIPKTNIDKIFKILVRR